MTTPVSPLLQEMLVSAMADAVAARVAERLSGRLDAIERRLPPNLVPIPQSASALGTTPGAIRVRVQRGTIPFTRQGRRVFIDLDACRAPSESDVSALAAKAGRR